jgi:hypothetical protein
VNAGVIVGKTDAMHGKTDVMSGVVSPLREAPVGPPAQLAQPQSSSPTRLDAWPN